MDEAAIRALVATHVDDSEITSVLLDERWCAVLLTDKPANHELLQRIHAHLQSALPDCEIEIRAGGRIYRGGYCNCEPDIIVWPPPERN